MAERCGAPVRVPGVFTNVDTDLGHTCLRIVGHEGAHRWQPHWESLAPDQVEAQIAAFDADEDEDDDGTRPDG